MSNEEEEEEEEEENKNEAKFKKRGISPGEQKRQGSKVMTMKTGEKKEDKMKVFTKERRDNKEVNFYLVVISRHRRSSTTHYGGMVGCCDSPLALDQ